MDPKELINYFLAYTFVSLHIRRYTVNKFGPSGDTEKYQGWTCSH